MMVEKDNGAWAVAEADLNDQRDAADTLALVRAFARDPFGQGRDLDAPVREVLIERLRRQPGALIFLARAEDRPVGVAVCFLGFSAFTARPILNVHDLFVEPAARGRGVARRLLEAVEAKARSLNCSRLTLEVQERNAAACRLYEHFGFGEGAYDESAGRVLSRWKLL